MLIGLAILALLFKLGVPSFRTWIQNTEIRNAAQSIANGMSIARGEAVHRNVTVQLQLSALTDGTQPRWQVALVSATGTAIQKWSSAEGASIAQLVQTGGGIVTFNGAGRVVSPNPSDASAPLLQVDVTGTTAASDAAARPLRVQIGTGGMARVCDPQLAQTDPRAC